MISSIAQSNYVNQNPKSITSLQLFSRKKIEQGDRIKVNSIKSIKSICKDNCFNQQECSDEKKMKDRGQENGCGSLGLIIIGENHVKNICNYQSIGQLKQLKKNGNNQNNEHICGKFQQYNEFVDQRQIQILSNKYKSNVVYLQIQIKQLMKLYTYINILQQQRQIKNTIIRTQSQMRRLKLDISEKQRNKSKQKEKNRKIKVLQDKIYHMKNKFNLSKEKQSLDNKIFNQLTKFNNFSPLSKKYQKKDSAGVSNYFRINSLNKETCRPSSTEQKEPNKIVQQNSSKYINIVEQNHQSSSLLKNDKSIQKHAISPRYSLPQQPQIQHQLIQQILQTKGCSLKQISQIQINRVRVYRNEDEYKKLLQQRVQILKDGIKRERRERDKKIQNITKQIKCISKNIHLFTQQIQLFSKYPLNIKKSHSYDNNSLSIPQFQTPQKNPIPHFPKKTASKSSKQQLIKNNNIKYINSSNHQNNLQNQLKKEIIYGNHIQEQYFQNIYL